jgi:transposase
VILKAISGQLPWWQAAEILGISCRSMRRWKQRYEQRGYDGLFDRRRRRPSPRRVPLATVQRVLRLYQEQYQGFNVAHFCDQLRAHHGLTLSYQWIKTALQTSGAVTPRAKHGRHHQRRARRPMRGMMLYVAGSTHAWIPSLVPAQFDLVAVMDDADTDCYYAQLVEQEGTRTVMAGLEAVVREQGLFCSLYTDRGSHFFHTPKAGGAVDKSQLTEIGRAGIRTVAEANRYIREKFLPWHRQHWTAAAAEKQAAFVPCGSADLDAIFCVQQERSVAADNTVTVGAECGCRSRRNRPGGATRNVG